MTQITLPGNPEEATKILLKKLPGRRMRDILEKRFGLGGGKKKTLEAVGKEYKITRERVRQIESDALSVLARPENNNDVEPFFHSMKERIDGLGAVVAEHHFFSSLPSAKYAPHVAFLLKVGKAFERIGENSNFHRRWTTDKNSADLAEKMLERTSDYLSSRGHPVSREELHGALAKYSEEVCGKEAAESVRDNFLAFSKLIGKNPYGEFGLNDWPTITPRGVKDKAFLVLSKEARPLHFREVADAINKTSWSKRKAHPQTVHNELIKDKRFVLVGRGLYALKEWGYEAGTVRDILVSAFKSAGRPLSRDEIVKIVLEKRFVKPPTILLNLQDKALFKRVDGEMYALV